MSTPIRSDERIDDALQYAPRWAREGAPEESAGQRLSNAPPMAPGVGGPNIELPPLHAPFEGDLAVKELRRRMSLDPQLVPPPPIAMRRDSLGPPIIRTVMLVTAAVLVACGVTFLSFSAGDRAQPDTGNATVGARTSPQAAEKSLESPRFSPVRFVVEGRRAFANEPLPLGISLNGASGRESILLSGLVMGTRLSAGQQYGLTAWRVPATEVSKLMAYAPKDFVGIMEAAVDLRSPRDALVDSQLVRLEWLPKRPEPAAKSEPNHDQGPPSPALRPLESEELALLLRRGHELLEQGDIAGARLMLRRAADAGNVQAALSLGATYDPVFLEERGVLGLTPNIEKARAWYQRATALGSEEASRRMARLAHAGN